MPRISFLLRGDFTNRRAYVDQQTPAMQPLEFDANGFAFAEVVDGPHIFTWFVSGSADTQYDVGITEPDTAKWADSGTLIDGQDQGIRPFHT